MKKYELTGKIKTVEGISGNVTLHRIRAIKSFGKVKAGECGGWIEDMKNLSEDGAAWVYGEAQVYGESQIFGDAQVCGNAQICDKVKVYGNALVSGEALICDTAEICGDVRIYGEVQIYNMAQICGCAQVFDEAEVYGNARICGNAQIYGSATVYANAHICGNAQIYGNAKVHGNVQVGGNAQVYGNIEICDKAKIFGCLSGNDESMNGFSGMLCPVCGAELEMRIWYDGDGKPVTEEKKKFDWCMYLQCICCPRTYPIGRIRSKDDFCEIQENLAYE